MSTLTALVLDGTPVSDLSPLKGLSVNSLQIQRTKVADLTPLRSLPLRQIRLDFRADRDTEVLRSLKGLEMINHKPVAEFWKD
jgi:Leucine-rich repeat (LRR) protein